MDSKFNTFSHRALAALWDFKVLSYTHSLFIVRSQAANVCDQLGVLLDFNNHIHENLFEKKNCCVYRGTAKKRRKKLSDQVLMEFIVKLHLLAKLQCYLQLLL